MRVVSEASASARNQPNRRATNPRSIIPTGSDKAVTTCQKSSTQRKGRQQDSNTRRGQEQWNFARYTPQLHELTVLRRDGCRRHRRSLLVITSPGNHTHRVGQGNNLRVSTVPPLVIDACGILVNEEVLRSHVVIQPGIQAVRIKEAIPSLIRIYTLARPKPTEVRVV